MKATLSSKTLTFEAHPVLGKSETVPTGFGTLSAKPGDWVITQTGGTFSTVVSPAMFHEMFTLEDSGVEPGHEDSTSDDRNEAAEAEAERQRSDAEVLQARRDARMAEIARHQRDAIKAAEKGPDKKDADAHEELVAAGKAMRERGPVEAPVDDTTPATPADSTTDQPKEPKSTTATTTRKAGGK